MAKYNLSQTDVKSIKKLLLSHSTEEKVMEYLSSHDNPELPSHYGFKEVIIAFLVVITICSYVCCVFISSVYGVNYLDQFLAPFTNFVKNGLALVWWVSVIFMLILPLAIDINETQDPKTELITLKTISDVVNTFSTAKFLGWIITIISLVAFITASYWLHLIFYFVVLAMALVSRTAKRKELKKAIERLDNSKSIDHYRVSRAK